MNRFSRLPVRTSQVLETGSTLKEPRLSRNENRRTRANSTGRNSNSKVLFTPSLRRSSSSVALKPTPQSVHRARSISANRQWMKKDERPIQDKKWQTEMLQKTQQYFQNNPQGLSILNQGKNLRPITNSMFVQLVNIVLKSIDERFEELTTTNYVELLPKILNRLMYPVNVTSSMMKTANTMHTWPHILAILSWLVELHYIIKEFDAIIDDNLFALPTDIPKEELRDLQILQLQSKTQIAAFVKWNKGEETDEVFKLFSRNLKEIYKSEYETSQNLKQNIEKLTNQKSIDFKRIKKENEEIEEQEKECETLTKQYTYAEEIVAQQKEYVRKAEAKIAKYKEDNKKLREADEKCGSKILELDQKLKKQTLTKKERDTLLQDVAMATEKSDALSKKREHILQISDEIDLKMSQTKREMEEKISAHNQALLKPSLKHPELKAFVVEASSLRGEGVQQYLQELTEKFELALDNKLNDERHNLSAARKQNLQQQNELENLIKENNALQLKLDDVKHNIETKIDDTDQKVNSLKKDIESIQKKISYLKQYMPNVEHIKRDIKLKAEEYQILKTKLQTIANEKLEYFETLEQEIVQNMMPIYQYFRKDISDSIENKKKIRNAQKKSE